MKYQMPDGALCIAEKGITLAQLIKALEKQGIQLTGKRIGDVHCTRRVH